MIKNAIVRNFVLPLVERLGTMLAAYLIARGVESDLAAQLVNGLLAAALVGCDLFTSKVNRIKQEANLLAMRKKRGPRKPKQLEMPLVREAD